MAKHTARLIKLRHFLARIIMITPLTGCALLGGYGAKGQSKDDFVRYVEQVFRLQNKMTSEIMVLSDNEDVAQQYPNLSQAEQQMQKMCADLNEYVSRDLDGLRTGILLRRRVEKSALDCEKSAHAVETLLKNPSASTR
jgi:hypothetical protein